MQAMNSCFPTGSYETPTQLPRQPQKRYANVTGLIDGSACSSAG